jgi:iron complex outermembrane recepter protein
MRTLFLCATGMISVLAVPAAALAAADAQSAPAADAPPSADSGLKEIIVTAQRHSENVQHAAVAITALSGSALRDEAKNSIAAAIQTAPSVVIQGNANGAQIYVRGVGSNADSQVGDSAVNLNVDGVYQQETEVPTSLMFDVDRIEVLRGPQGTLYGRNSTAGAINVITTDPSLDRLGGYATLQGGNYAGIHSEAAVNVPVSDTVAVRGAFASERHDGYLSNGNDDADIKAGRLKLLYKPSSDLRVVVAGDYMHSDGHDVGTVVAPLSSHSPWDSDKPQGYLRIDAWNVRAQADYTTNVTDLTLLASHSFFSKDEASVLLGLPGAGDHRTGRQDSVEFRAASPAESAIKWVGGLYYYNGMEWRQTVAEPVSYELEAAGDPEMRAAGTSSWAAFANITVPVAEHVRATGGLRYTDDEKSARYFYSDASEGTIYSSKHWHSLTYKGEIEADLAQSSLLYAEISSGFKAGGYVQQYPVVTYNPEKITAFEIGSKNRFFDNKVQLNLSGFYYKYHDYQASYADIIDGGFVFTTVNASSADIYGLEAETKFKLSSNDTLGANFAYLHSKFGYFVYTSVLSGTVDHSYETLPNSPKETVDFNYEHQFHLSNQGLITAHIDTHISSGYWVTVERTLDSYQQTFTRSNAFISYTPAGQAWTARLFVRNLENTPVRTLAQANPNYSVLMLAAPRTYGGSLTVHF